MNSTSLTRTFGVVLSAALLSGVHIPRAASAQAAPVVHAPLTPVSDLPRYPFDMGAPDLLLAERLAGCFTVALGVWSAGDPVVTTIPPAPARIDLTTEPHTRVYIGFRLVARTPDFAAGYERTPAAWGPIAPDSAQIRAWADGKSSLMFFVRRKSDSTLAGTARYFGESRREDAAGRWMWETYPSAPVSLVRTSC